MRKRTLILRDELTGREYRWSGGPAVYVFDTHVAESAFPNTVHRDETAQECFKIEGNVAAAHGDSKAFIKLYRSMLTRLVGEVG